MISKLNKRLQLIRDAILIVFSIVIMSTSYGKWVDEPVHYVLFGMAAGLISLSVINIILILAKTQRRGYFYFNAIVQLPLDFILTGLGLFIGPVFFILNTAIIVTLRKENSQKKSK